MGLFDADAERLQGLYHRAWKESGMGAVDPRNHPYLNKALIQHAKENHCTYDEAWAVAKNVKK